MSEIWFDTRLGEQLIGEDAVMLRLEESGPGDVVPLHELLTAEEFPFKAGDFECLCAESWDEDKLIALGSATMRLLNDAGKRPLLNTTVMRRLHWLGIGPDAMNVASPRGVFRTMQDFRTAVGSEEVGYSTRGKFDCWTTNDFAVYAKTLAQDLGRKPRAIDYEQRSRRDRNAPTISVLTSRFTGGVSELNEYIGYPNVKSWDKDEYIDFGVKFVEVNGADALAFPGIIVVSSKQRGPGYTSITRKFPVFHDYKQQVISEYRQRAITKAAERQSKLDRYRAQITDGTLPAVYGGLDDDELLALGGRHSLALHIAPQLSDAKRSEVVAATSAHYFTNYLLRAVKDVTAADIEIEASIIGVFDDIWPMDDYRQYLRVTPEEINAVRERKRATKLAWAQRQSIQ